MKQKRKVERLEKRRKAFDASKSKSDGAYHRPGSLKK